MTDKSSLDRLLDDGESGVAVFAVFWKGEWQGIFRLTPDVSVTIGRSEECDITLRDKMCSRKHVRLDWNGTSWIITDLGSRNGVRINDEKIEEPTGLRHDDTVRIGKTKLIYSNVVQDSLFKDGSEPDDGRDSTVIE